LVISIFLVACRNPQPPAPPQSAATATLPAPALAAATSLPGPASETITLKAEVWADNWFAFYSGAQLIREDSVPITTERSFNSETFTFEASYPLTLNFIAKDFKENDTGLEYIGTNRQQMGDGGLIAQFTNAASGELLAVTDANWVCLVIHEAPLDPACEKSTNPVAGEMPCGFTALPEPAGWKEPNFEASAWSPATLYTAQQVGPKDGYGSIAWVPSAKFIWGPDLKTDNTILCRLTIAAPR
jgi:hypothetical protein